MRLGRALIFVPDIPRAKAFYRDVLGLSLRRETAEHLVFSTTTSSSSWTLIVFRCDKSGSIGDYANEPRSVLVFEVDSIESAMRELAGKGVQFLHSEPGRNEFGRYAAFTDPFKNVHEIFEPTA
jgi:catechol 2,3-dioxygenase-like lactoylglutathione lyase family enzyme